MHLLVLLFKYLRLEMSTATAFKFLELQSALRLQERPEQSRIGVCPTHHLQAAVAQPSLQKEDLVLATALFIAMLTEFSLKLVSYNFLIYHQGCD